MAFRSLNHLFLLLFSALLVSCATRPHLSHLPDQQIAVPMHLRGGLPFVTVEIGGTPHEFLLDSGASDCVVTPAMVQRLGLPLSRESVPVRTAAGETVPLRMTMLPEVRMGKTVFQDVPCLVHDCEKPRQVFPNLEGIMGFSLFRDTLLTMDYPDRKIIVSPWKPLDPRDPAVVTMPIQLGVPKVPVKYQRSQTFVDVDTGSNGGLELNLSKLKAPLTGPPQPTGLSMSIGSNYRNMTGRIDGSLFIGSVELVAPVVEITRGDQRLGGQILQNLMITFDTKSGLAFVDFGRNGYRYGQPKLASPSRIGSGLSFDPAWRVRDLVPGSPAYKAGLRVGDACVAIEGVSVRQMGISDYQKLLGEREQIRYQFVRQGRNRTVDIPVVYMVR